MTFNRYQGKNGFSYRKSYYDAATWFGQTCYLLGEVYGFLIDFEILEHESHLAILLSS